MAAIFETETCSRCGGTGEYSYCQSHGTTCFKCGGKKYVLTKRGQEAQRYFIELQSKNASEVKEGDIISHMGYKGKVIAVKEETAIKDLINGEFQFNPERISIELENISLGTFKTAKVRTYDAESFNKAKEIALEYQKTLTKQGKVKKR